MRRNLLGIIAAILLVLGVASMVGGPGGESARQFSGVCIRSGLVLGALWLALPQIFALVAKAPRWLMGWFVGKNKPTPQATAATSQSSTSQRPMQQPRRPRRRSGS